MEPKISFIPKQPIIERARPARPVGAFFGLALLVFFGSVSAYGGLFYYNIDAQKKVEDARTAVEQEAERIDPDGTIVRAREVRDRIAIIKDLLDNHIATTPILDLLERVTVRTVRLKDFSFSVVEPEKVLSAGRATVAGAIPAEREYVVTLSGSAVGYGALALQRDAFLAEKNAVEKAVISNIALDQKGNVEFTARLTIRPEYLSYAGLFPVASAPVSESEQVPPEVPVGLDEEGSEVPPEVL